MIRQFCGARSERGEERIEVEDTTLDEAALRLGGPDLVKMDIEGGEAQAIRSTSSVLEKMRPVFLMELHGPSAKAEVPRMLVDSDYDLLSLDGVPVDPADRLPKHILAKPRRTADMGPRP